MATAAKHVVVVGGGFAGVNLVKELSKNEQFHVTLVDKNNYNFFPPLIYQVSAGFLEPSNISYPFRKLFRSKKNVGFRMAQFLRVEPAENKIVTSNGDVHYDYLVFATGTQSNFFGLENVMKHAVPMKTINDAIELRNYLLQVAEKATITESEEERKKLLTIVVAGGGPSGVEISGILAEMRHSVVKKDYPELREKLWRLYLVDSGEHVLGPMSTKSQNYTQKSLEKLGVKVMLKTQVKDYVDNEVLLGDGNKIATATLIWTAGVIAVELPGIPKEVVGRGRRVMVDEFNKVQGTNNIYAIGDCSLQTTDKNFPGGHPQLAQVAIQQGVNLAKNLSNSLRNREWKPFSYKDKGSMAIIGRNKAVADIGKLHFNGLFAAGIWAVIHIWSLINYRNRIKTFFNWTSAYLTRDLALRFIFRPDKRVED